MNRALRAAYALTLAVALTTAGCTVTGTGRPSPRPADPGAVGPPTTSAPSTTPVPSNAPGPPVASASPDHVDTRALGEAVIPPGRVLDPPPRAGAGPLRVLGCGPNHDCRQVPDPVCNRWYALLGPAAVDLIGLDRDATLAEGEYATGEGVMVSTALLVAGPELLDRLSVSPLGGCRHVVVEDAAGAVTARTADAEPLTGTKPLGDLSHAYVQRERGGGRSTPYRPRLVKEVRFGTYFLQVSVSAPIDGRPAAEPPAATLDAVAERAYTHARRVLAR